MQSDALEFLQRERGHYGVIFVDPPTFSNSKRAEDFDVQRDHVALLKACGDRLTRDGVIVFSNNFRRFKLDRAALEEHFAIEDWTAPSIPVRFRPPGRYPWLLAAAPRKPDPGVNPWDTRADQKVNPSVHIKCDRTDIAGE